MLRRSTAACPRRPRPARPASCSATTTTSRPSAGTTRTGRSCFVSGKDATEINARYAQGNGLMRGGSSINNMMNGDAEKSLLTLADFKTARPGEGSGARATSTCWLLNPYFLMRTIVLILGDAVRELWQGWQQRRRGRAAAAESAARTSIPSSRAATTVFMRDVAANLAVLDIVRGVALDLRHLAGLRRGGAPFRALDQRRLRRRWPATTRSLRRIRRAIAEKAPRPYDLIILSDHGQSFGATFKQRYGLSASRSSSSSTCPQGTTVAQSIGGDTGITSLAGCPASWTTSSSRAGSARRPRGGQAGAEGWWPAGVQEQESGGRDGARPGDGLRQRQPGPGLLRPASRRRSRSSELNAAYPGMVDALVQHEGIGIVGGYDRRRTRRWS